MEGNMTRFIRHEWLSAVLLVAALLLAAPAAAQQKSQQKSQQKTREILSAVVGIRAKIPAAARTAPFLGTERRGSGVVIDSGGLILTIGYLILEAEKIEVVTADAKTLPATYVGYDSGTGFGMVRAVGRLEAKPIPLGASGALSARNPVLVVSREEDAQMKTAMVVSRRNFAGYWEYLLEDAIFTAPAVPNFAGAALLDSDLRLVGIGSLFVGDAAEKGVSLAGNMFVPIEKLSPILADLIAVGRSSAPPRPWLGVYLTEGFGRVFVTRVASGSPALKQGIGAGDILLTVGPQEILGMEDFYRKLWSKGNAGTRINLKVLQGVEVKEISILSTDRSKHYRRPPLR